MPPGNQYKDLLMCHDNLDRIEKVIRGKRNPIIVGDLNFRPGGENERDLLLTTCLSNWGLRVNVSDHFLLKKRYKRKGTWRSPDGSYWQQCDYIFSGSRHEWKSLRYIQPRSVSSDHLMFMATLYLRHHMDHRRYRYERTKNSLNIIRIYKPNTLHMNLETIIDHREWSKKCHNKKGVWISDRTTRIAERRAQIMHKKWPSEEKSRTLNRLKRQLRESLKRDR